MELLAELDTPGHCPDRDTIADFDSGRLPDERLEWVAAHLSACDKCMAVIRQIDKESPDDSIDSNLRKIVAAPTLAHDPAYAAMEAAAKAIGRPNFEYAPDTSKTSGKTKESQIPLPRAIGPYVVRSVLGHGGMGIVYLAYHEVLNRPVALKMIRDGAVARDTTRARFRTEGEAVARLEHPNVVRVFHYDECDGHPYFAMEPLEGGSLARKLAKEGPLPVRAAAELVRSLADAVQCAHDQRVLHRDLKPGNVLFDSEGTPKIVDFGLAKFLDDDRDGPTCTDMIVGTPSYMAPEQAMGRAAEIGPLSDVYALGAILYECLTGHPVFHGENKIQTLERVVRDPVVPPTQLRKEIPAELEAICLKCLEKSLLRRYPTSQSLSDDLNRWLNGEPTVARPAGWWTRQGRRLRKYRRAAVPAAVTLFFAMGGGLLAYYAAAPMSRVELADAAGFVVRGAERKKVPFGPRPRFQTEKAGAVVAADGSMTVTATGICILDYIPPPATDRFRFRVSVLHRADATRGGESRVGVFFGCSSLSVPVGGTQLVGTMRFNDLLTPADLLKTTSIPIPVLPKGSDLCRTRFSFLTLDNRQKQERASTPYYDLGNPNVEFAPQRAGGNTWRDVEIEVTPKGVKGTWDGQHVAELSAQDITKLNAKMLEDLCKKQPDNPTLAKADPAFTPTGGVGIVVERGSASFRGAEVIPLKADE